jgi:hypothetical protein
MRDRILEIIDFGGFLNFKPTLIFLHCVSICALSLASLAKTPCFGGLLDNSIVDKIISCMPKIGVLLQPKRNIPQLIKPRA